MCKQILKAVGPLLAAFFLVGALLFSPLNRTHKYTSKELDSFVISMTKGVFISETIKRQAFSNKKYLPLMGSSELSRFDPFHPSILAKKYNRDYTPFLIGSVGTQSLTHYFYLNELGKEIANRKIVFVISPQWFECKKNKQGKVVSKRIAQEAFAEFVSMEGIYQWTKSAEPSNVQTQFLARRLLEFPSINRSSHMKELLISLGHGAEPAKYLQFYNNFQYSFTKAEDSLFEKEALSMSVGIKLFEYLFQKQISPISTVNVKQLEKKLPADYDNKELDSLAYQLGKEESSQNSLWINNKFYDRNIRAKIKEYKNFQAKTSYLHGIEYNDFQLLLNLFAKNNNDVLFVVPPVNKRWAKYAGLRQSMLEEFASKIKRQLNSQGFNNVVDYVNRGVEPYFMTDAIHLGKRGWVALDQDIIKFLKSKSKPGKYKINNKKFLSSKWLDEG
jgi:D-alanine transfer protein